MQIKIGAVIYRAHLKRVLLAILLTCALTLPVALTLLPLSSTHNGALTKNIVSHILSRHDLVVDPASIITRDDELGSVSGGLSPREIYFLGHPRGSRHRDVYFTHLILSDKAIPVHASPAFSLTNTSAADEQDLHFDGQRYLAFSAVIKGKTSVVTILDLQGLSPAALTDFTPMQKLQQHLTSWQETGRWRGQDRIEVKLTLPQAVRLTWRKGHLRIEGKIGDWAVTVDPMQAKVISGPGRARLVRVGKRSFLPWAVDTVRSFSWVGPEVIVWLEETFYGFLDRARRISGDEITDEEIKDEMALPVQADPSAKQIDGWPPPPLPPILRRRIKGEGQWVDVRGPFLRHQPGMPSVFAMTFVRPDKERLFARVYFVAWDPRRLDLKMVGGTKEPRSATGEIGRGMIPRDPQQLPRLVAAFNGGFQTMHGDFGMMVNKKIYCPPMPWAATVARLADGSTAMGTWDGKAKIDGIPPWIHSFRQNLTPLVEDGKFNPWRRGSWGGGTGFITGSGPKAFIIRSGLCLHKSGHLMFVMGNPVDGPTLGKVMHKVGCDYGLQLDINKGHVGFEFFNVLAAGEQPPAETARFKNRHYFAHTGSYPKVEGLRYYMREVIRKTGNNPVPRWTGREARDFFYLELRHTLPGQDLKPLNERPNEGRWTTATLPPAAVRFPQAMARTFLHPTAAQPDVRVHLVKLDLRWLETTLCLPDEELGCLPAAGTKEGPLAILPLGQFSAERVLLGDGKELAGSRGGAPSLALAPARPQGPMLPQLMQEPDLRPGSISIQGMAPPASVPPSTDGASPRSLGALCIGPDGMLVYAVGLGVDHAALEASCRAAGAKQTLHLGPSEPLLLGKATGYETVFGEILPPVATTPSLLLRRAKTSWAPRIFTHVKPQPRYIWTKGQPERTRASALRHAKRAIKALGLPPIKKLKELCKPPYREQEELRTFRWRDPRTGKVCGKLSRRWKRNKAARRKKGKRSKKKASGAKKKNARR